MNIIDWLFGVGRRRDIEAMARAVWHQLELAPVKADGFEPTDAELRQVMARISVLTRLQRRVLKLYVVEKLTYREVATRLGITPMIALRELSRVMQALIVPPMVRP